MRFMITGESYMTFQKGDVVLIPFPYTDLLATKTRPATVVSSSTYHNFRSELLLAYISSRLAKAHPTLDHVLVDWAIAGLPRRPSFVRPKLATIDPSLVVHKVGKLSDQDQLELDRHLRLAMALTETSLIDIVAEVDLTKQPATIIQSLAEQSISAVKCFVKANTEGVDIERLRKLLQN